MRTLLPFFFLFLTFTVFAQWQERIVTDQAVSPSKVIAVDLDGDGWIDIVSMNFQKIEWYKNLGDGSFSQGIFVGELMEGRDIAVGDIDGDGDLDIIAVKAGYYLPYNTYLYENTGNGVFAPRVGISTPHNEGGYRMKIVDIDNDGLPDILEATVLNLTLAWYKNLGDHNFDEGTIISSGYIGGQSLDVGDIDDDGFMDIVISTPNNRVTSWFRNIDGTGDFEGPIEVGTRKANMLSLFLADIDGDGDLDVIGAGSVHSEYVFSWWENLDGLGDFSLHENVIDTEITTYIYPVDLDNDGDLDVLALEPGYLKWYKNTDGLGNFNGPTIIKDDIPFAITVTAADLLNNGTMNPISASQRLNTIYWFEPENIGVSSFVESTIKVYPNPVEDILNIQADFPILSVRFYDITHREVLQLTGDVKEINLSMLQEGLYFMHIDTPEGKVLEKIVKK